MLNLNLRILTTATVVCLFLDSCSQASNTKDKLNKVDTLSNKTTVLKINNRAERFDSFFERFKADSDFQISRITFPVKVSANSDEGQPTAKFESKSDWKYTDFTKIKNVVIKQSVIGSGKMKVNFAIKDTGVNVDYFFINKEGTWWLNAIQDKSD